MSERIIIDVDDALNSIASECMSTLKSRNVDIGKVLFAAAKEYIDEQGIILTMTLNENTERTLGFISTDGLHLIESFDEKPDLDVLQATIEKVVRERMLENIKDDNPIAMELGYNIVVPFENTKAFVIKIDFPTISTENYKDVNLEYESSILEFEHFVLCEKSSEHINIYKTPEQIKKEEESGYEDDNKIISVSFSSDVKTEDNDNEEELEDEDLEDEDF